MLSSLPPPPQFSAQGGVPPSSGDLKLIGAERRLQTWFALYVIALFGVISTEAGTIYGALFVLCCVELVMSLWRPAPKLPATSFQAPGNSAWQTPIRALRLYLLAREFASYAWGFVVTTIFMGFFIVVARPPTIRASNLVVAGLFLLYFATRPLWYPSARRLLGESLQGIKKALAKGGPRVRLSGDGIDVFQPVVVLNGPPHDWLWHVRFDEIDDMRTLGALEAEAYWRSMLAYDPTMVMRAGWELQQYVTGRIPRPSIYQYIAAGLHLLVRGPSVLYVLAYADDSGPAAVAAWQQSRAAHATVQVSSGGNLHG